MALVFSSITVADFKNQFLRSFPYLKAWSSLKTYAIGDQVSYNSSIYQALTANTNKTPDTETSDWQEIDIDECNFVTDSDITNAFSEAQIVLNQGLFTSDDNAKLGYLYLTAHYLTLDLRAASKGINSNGSFNVSSRSVGSVSESYGLPEWITKDPILGYFALTDYGRKYLSMVMPSMIGNVFSVEGATRP
jgi:hypothetical protein